MADRTRLSPSARRVITLLCKYGPQSKGQLASSGDMGWSTVVKAVNQLLDVGVIGCVGKTRTDMMRQGKHAYVYGLSPQRPLAIGVDVEVKTTRIVLNSLAGNTLASAVYKTPQQMDDERSRRFFEETIEDFVHSNNVEIATLDGIGVGFPGIGFPTNSTRDNLHKARRLESQLSRYFGTVVRFEINTKAYAAFEKWRNERFTFSNFIYVSIRTGVGTGIFYKGNLYMGVQGLAGEIGHMKVVPHGPACRCGGTGCMETVVNQHYLYQQYRTNVLRDTSVRAIADDGSLLEGLSDLFTRAKQGDVNARSIVDTAGSYLGYCIANAIAVLDISNVILSGHFGPDGDALVAPVTEAIRANIMPRIDFTVKYVPIDPNGHTQGAALLVWRDYFVDIPEHLSGIG